MHLHPSASMHLVIGCYLCYTPFVNTESVHGGIYTLLFLYQNH